jgi:hypothetical protein
VAEECWLTGVLGDCLLELSCVADLLWCSD